MAEASARAMQRAGSPLLPDIIALYSGGPDFGAINSAPLEALLKIVSKGNALLVDLLRLSGSLPLPLLADTAADSRFAPVLFDFRYFKDAEAHERRVDADADLVACEEQFREAHGDVLREIWTFFQEIVELHASLVDFLHHLQQGGFIQCTLDSLLMTVEGKQLVCEAVALIGALLLALDRRMPGPVRERAVVAYYRQKGGAQAVGQSANAVIALCSATGFQANKRIPAGYPEAYFSRLPLPQDVVLRVVSTIRADDVYHQTFHFPAPEHRTVALANQAALLYLALYFVPQVLHRDAPLMRTLVDRHFADKWMVAWGPGFTTDLALEWDGFKAARAALYGSVTVMRARDVAATLTAAIPGIRERVANYLVEGQLNEEHVLQHIPKILNCLRNGNVALRWLLLHTAGSQKKLRSAVAAAAPAGDELLSLLLDIALLEFQVKRVYGMLIDSKEERWRAQQVLLSASISELSSFFRALQAIPRTSAPPDFSAWFEHLNEQVDAMQLDDPSGSSRRVQGVVAALSELERFHSGEASIQTAHYLSTIRAHLAHLLRVADVREEVLHTLAAISDFAYGWGLLDAHLPRLQAQVRREPGTVAKLQSLFVKARSLLELPLLRLGQANSPLLPGVSRFYSSALLAFAHRVLQVVPGTLWELLDAMVVIRTQRMAALGTRVEATALKEAAQLAPRAALANYSARIAAFAHGIFTIDKTKIGVLELDAMKLLEQGMRSQLALRIAGAGATTLTFPQAPVPLLQASPFGAQRGALAAVFGAGASFSGELPGRGDLAARLAELAARLAGLRSSFEHIQDFINLPGLQIWYQQLHQVLAANLAKEARVFGQKPIVQNAAEGEEKPAERRSYGPQTFLGRVTGELLRLSAPHRTQYFPLEGAWQDASRSEAVGLATFRALGSALTPAGLAAVDRLLGLRVQHTLQDALINLRDSDPGMKDGLQRLASATGGTVGTREGGPAAYMDAAHECARVLDPLLDVLLAVGQAQLLRRQVLLELRNIFATNGTGAFVGSLAALNDATLADIQAGSLPPSHPSSLPIIRLAEATGMDDPMQRIYIRPSPAPGLPQLLFLLMVSATGRCRYSRQLGILERVSKGAPDACVLAAGIATLLQQLDPVYIKVILQHAGQWVRAYVQAATGSVAQGIEAAGIKVALPQNVGLLLAFLDELGRYGNVSRSLIVQHVPPFIYDTWLSVLN